MNNLNNRSAINIDTVKFSVRGMVFDLPSDIVTVENSQTGIVLSKGNNRLALHGDGPYNLISRGVPVRSKLANQRKLERFVLGIA
jgi:hypothetical protein